MRRQGKFSENAQARHLLSRGASLTRLRTPGAHDFKPAMIDEADGHFGHAARWDEHGQGSFSR